MRYAAPRARWPWATATSSAWPVAPTPSWTASAATQPRQGLAVVRPRDGSPWSACPATHGSTSPGSGNGRSAWPGPTPTAPRPWPTAPTGARSTWPSTSSTPPTSAASSAPPTPSPATGTPSRTPPTPAPVARCASPSTSATKRSATVPRPGFVLDVDRSTPPILFHHGEGFRLEKLPAGRSRVIYPAEPLDALEHPDAAIRHALANPVGDSEPLAALLKPGMKLTIAFDDISLPLPPMRRPDIRQRVIEAVLDLAAAAGVDDVVLIAALALHRRMTEAELRHAVGDRVYDAFAPHGLLVQPRRRGPRQPRVPRHHRPRRRGRDQQAGRRERPDRLRQHQPRVHGRRLEVDRHRPVQLPEPAPPPQRARRCSTRRSFMDQHASELHSSNWRMGKVLRDSGVKVFQIETTMNNDVFGTDGPLSRAAEARVGVAAQGPHRLRRHEGRPGPDAPAPGARSSSPGGRRTP